MYISSQLFFSLFTSSFCRGAALTKKQYYNFGGHSRKSQQIPPSYVANMHNIAVHIVPTAELGDVMHVIVLSVLCRL